MLTATYDATLGSNSFRNLYVDGVQVASHVGGDINAAAKTTQFTVGYNQEFGGRDYAGSIDEVAVWNYGLTDSQVATLYASADQATAPGVVPEPATWAMMIAGFGLAGGVLRTDRRKAGAFA